VAASEPAASRAAEDGAGANDMAKGGARQQPGQPEGLDHVVMRLLQGHALGDARSKTLTLNRHAEDDNQIADHHDERLGWREGRDGDAQREERGGVDG